MLRFISLRLLFALPALWLIVTMVFLLAHIVPGDPVQQMLGEGARAEDLQQLRHALGLDLPAPVQYGRYMGGILHGTLGESSRFQQPVLRVILSHYPATLELAIVALFVCAAVGIPAGMLAAQRRGTATDRAIGVFTLFGLSVPNFALGPVLILLFSVILGWLPVSGRGGPLRHPARRRARRDSHSHGPHFGNGGALERLRPHRSRDRPLGIRGSFSPRLPQRANSHPHDSGIAIRHAPGRNNRHRVHFFLARHRPPLSPSNRSTRLPAAPRLHSPNCRFVRAREPPHRFRLRPSRPKGAPRMTAIGNIVSIVGRGFSRDINVGPNRGALAPEVPAQNIAKAFA